MAQKIRKSYDGAFKAKVALEAIKGEKTMAQFSSEYGLHVNQIGQWQKRLLQELPDVFCERRRKKEEETEEMTAELYRQIGQLKVELEWLIKNPRCYSSAELSDDQAYKYCNYRQ